MHFTNSFRRRAGLATDPDHPDAPVAENMRPIVPRRTPQLNRLILLRSAANTLLSRDSAVAAKMMNNRNEGQIITAAVPPYAITGDSAPRRHWLADAMVAFEDARKRAALRCSIAAEEPKSIIPPPLPSKAKPMAQTSSRRWLSTNECGNNATIALVDLSKRTPQIGLGRNLRVGVRKFFIKVCPFAKRFERNYLNRVLNVVYV